MTKAFFDASGTLNQGANYVLAGYFSPLDLWDELAEDWQAALDDSPKIDYFKVREAVLLINQFDGWPRKQADDKLVTFMHLVSRYVAGGVGIVLPTNLYLQHVRGKIPKEMDHPYYICFLACVEITAKLMTALGMAGPIDFVFDTENLEPKARVLFEMFKKWPWPQRGLIGEIDFRDDTKLLPLQTADGIAWLLRTELDNPDTYLAVGDDTFLTVDPPNLVLPPVLIRWFTEDKLIQYIDRFNAAMLSIDPTGDLLTNWPSRKTRCK